MLFVSYTRVDRDGIGTLLADVRTLGHGVWLDEELSGGQVWWNEILGKIRDCEAFLFMVSPSSVESEACLLELQYATALDRIIIPVHIAETSAPAALGVAVIGLLGWWWSGGILDSLMREDAIPTNSADIKLASE